ncbi:DUF4369 domain-containing protein [Gelidibacter gilvus]|nr:DUF4369 domain-containing protein [Gelidibacter gilvus]
MKNTITLLALILLFASCEKENKKTNNDRFELNVIAKNFPDSTKVVLYNREIDKNIDSTYVINERFKLSGKVDLPSLSYLFFYDGENKPIEHYKYLFVENKAISIVGEYSDFFNAQVKGSDQTRLLDEYHSLSQNNDSTTIASKQLEFLYSNANNQMALNELLYKKKQISKDSLFLFYKKLDAMNSNSPKGQELLAYSKTISLKIGDQFRDITGNDFKGVEHKLSNYYGKIILLNFLEPRMSLFQSTK